MKKAHRCPVIGCGKRSSRGGLMTHARDKHPEFHPEAYRRLLDGQPPAAARPKRYWLWFAAIPTAIAAVALVVLAYIRIDL